MEMVKIIERNTRTLFVHNSDCIWRWNNEIMELVLVRQTTLDWLNFLLNYKNLGAEIVDAYSDYNIERSTLQQLIKHYNV